MAKLLTDAELQEIRDGKRSAYGLVSTPCVGLLLDHIEAQAELLLSTDRDARQWQMRVNEVMAIEALVRKRAEKAEASAAAMRLMLHKKS